MKPRTQLMLVAGYLVGLDVVAAILAWRGFIPWPLALVVCAANLAIAAVAWPPRRWSRYQPE